MQEHAQCDDSGQQKAVRYVAWLTVMIHCGCQVAQILLVLCDSGREALAADLLAALANGRNSLAVARNAVVLLVRQV